MTVRLFTCRGVINAQVHAPLKMARPSSGGYYLIASPAHIQKPPLFSRCVCVSDLAAFRKIFSEAKNIAIITGAGVSAESGVPTFRGAGGYWRKWQAQVRTHLPFYHLLKQIQLLLIVTLQELATPEAFSRNPSRVWEFYHYRREVMLTKKPNPAHQAIAECEERLNKQGRVVTVITQNIDELHRQAGSKNLLEIHGK